MNARSWIALTLVVALLFPGGAMWPALADTSGTDAAPARGGSALAGGIEGTLTRQPLTRPPVLGNGSLEGLQYADPTEQLALIDPPAASSQGNATLTHTLLIPPGRGA